MNSPTSLGTRKVLSEPTQSWERVDTPVNEGPAAMYHGGKTFLSFSASFCWTSSYQLGLLTYKSGDPTLKSSWTKTGPLFSSANGNYGPGHNGYVTNGARAPLCLSCEPVENGRLMTSCEHRFFQSPDGTEIWNVYHATKITTGACDGNRYTAAKKVSWKSDGSPDFGKPDTVGTVLAGPSGE